MKQILLVAIAAGLLFFGAGLYLAHGEENPPSTTSTPAPPPTPTQPSNATTPKEYVVPRISRTDTPQRIRESKSCREYLSICERSCKDRGEMFKFACIGQDFQPFEDHSRCTCADDLYARREAPRQEVQVKQEQKETDK